MKQYYLKAVSQDWNIVLGLLVEKNLLRIAEGDYFPCDGVAYDFVGASYKTTGTIERFYTEDDGTIVSLGMQPVRDKVVDRRGQEYWHANVRSQIEIAGLDGFLVSEPATPDRVFM